MGEACSPRGSPGPARGQQTEAAAASLPACLRSAFCSSANLCRDLSGTVVPPRAHTGLVHTHDAQTPKVTGSPEFLVPQELPGNVNAFRSTGSWFPTWTKRLHPGDSAERQLSADPGFPRQTSSSLSFHQHVTTSDVIRGGVALVTSEAQSGHVGLVTCRINTKLAFSLGSPPVTAVFHV